MVSPNILLGPRLKAQRADQHINELIRATQPLDNRFYRLAVEPRTIPPYADGTFSQIVYRPRIPIPEALALIVGDAIHNLRAALDHLASGIVRTKDPASKPYFPVPKDRQNLETSGSLAQMERALPGSIELLSDKIRPINCATNYLWAFGTLDIDDKHNLVIPTVTFASIEAAIGVKGVAHRVNVGFGNDAAKPFVAFCGPLPLAVDDNPKATVDIRFGSGTVFERKPVIPTLLNIRNLVSETIDAFAELIGR